MNLLSKTDAREQGLTRYFTGGPCLRGHVAERITSNRRCVACANESSSEWKHANLAKCTATKRVWSAANREKMRTIKAAWNKANPEGQKARSRKWFLLNREKANAATKRWQEANVEQASASARVRRLENPEGYLAYGKLWRQTNLDKCCAYTSRRRADILKRTPSWADLAKIEAFYSEAKRLTEATGVEHNVDHIIPLRGKTVSGLHVETNLQVITAYANRSKSNRFQPERS